MEKQDYIISLAGRRVYSAMGGMMGHVEEISGLKGFDNLFSGAILEASTSGNNTAINLVISVIIPTGDDPWFSLRVKHPTVFAVEG